MERHVLVVFPHPDDETFGCGGTIAQFTNAGIPVTYVCGTLGQMGRNMGTPTFATRESLPHIRATELNDACAALGIQRLIKLGLRDKMIEFEDPEPIIDRIEQVVREVNPSLVLTHYPGYAVHPDHNALGALTIRAVSRLATEKRPTVYMHAISQEGLAAPDIVIDIAPVAEIKMAAIRAHRSQSEIILAQIENGQWQLKNSATEARLHHFLARETFWTYRFT